MKSKYSIILVMLLMLYPVFAADYSKEIKSNADKFIKANLKKDLKVIAEFTYPEIVKQSGGIEAMLEMGKKINEALQQKGIEIVDIKIGAPSKYYTVGKEIHTLLKQTTVLKVPDGYMTAEGSILAISQDKGKKWYFLAIAKQNAEMLGKIVKLDKNMPIPEQLPPTTSKTKPKL